MSVLAYYYEHQAEIDADFEREDEMMQHVPALSTLFEKYNWVTNRDEGEHTHG